MKASFTKILPLNEGDVKNIFIFKLRSLFDFKNAFVLWKHCQNQIFVQSSKTLVLKSFRHMDCCQHNQCITKK